MYNRYVPGSGGYTRIAVDEARHGQKQKAADQHTEQPRPHARTEGNGLGGTPFSGILGGEGKNAGIAGILKSLHLDGLDSGDILLLLIILLVFLDGDNTELVITLGLMLLLGFGDEGKNDQKE